MPTRHEAKATPSRSNQPEVHGTARRAPSPGTRVAALGAGCARSGGASSPGSPGFVGPDCQELPLAWPAELQHVVMVIEEARAVPDREVPEAQLAEALVEALLVVGGQRARGLVQDRQLRPAKKATRRSHALLLAKGERARPVLHGVQAAFEALWQAAEAEEPEHFVELPVAVRWPVAGVEQLRAEASQGHVGLLRQEDGLPRGRPHDDARASVPEARGSAQEAALACARRAHDEHALRLALGAQPELQVPEQRPAAVGRL
mmetsp:Transcript_65106/g.209863  ORF Transcript_65106/g.209863 Transcript_65106/m.209863 type:complete len:261 (+) Transcript_65106:255-1037(+)